MRQINKQAFGGWVNVVNICKDENFSELFNYNDFVVIQIDADISQEKGFDISHIKNGKTIDNRKLCDDIIKRLQLFIPNEVWNKYSNKFLFAIGINSIECWLIALVDSVILIKIQKIVHFVLIQA